MIKMQSSSASKPEWFLGYLAGIIDSSTSIGIYPKTGHDRAYKCHIMTQTNNDKVIRFLVDNVGGTSRKVKEKDIYVSKMFVWRISVKDFEPFLYEILPYLVANRERVELALDFAKTMTGSTRKLTEEVILQREEIYRKSILITSKRTRKKG